MFDAVANAIMFSTRTAHPRYFNIIEFSCKASVTGACVGGVIAVPKKKAEAKKVRPEMCHNDSECGAMSSWLIERTARMIT